MNSDQRNPPAGASTPATLWFRTNEKGEWMMNHLEEGHCLNDLPTPKVPSQKSVWGKGTWTREHVWLSPDVPPKVVHDTRNESARMLVTGQAH